MELLAQVPAGAYTVRNLTAGTQSTVTVPTLTASITQGPATVGATLTLTTNASARSTYQWRRNGSNIAGATSNTLATGAVAAGSIDCVVTSGLQSVTTAAITLSALVSRSITKQAPSLFGSFTTNATGTRTLDCGVSATAGQRLIFTVATTRVGAVSDGNEGITSATVGGQAMTRLVHNTRGTSVSLWEVTLTSAITPTTPLVLNWAAGVERNVFNAQGFIVQGYGPIVTTAGVEDFTAPFQIAASISANCGVILARTSAADNAGETVGGATIAEQFGTLGPSAPTLRTTTATAVELAAESPRTFTSSQGGFFVLAVLPPL